MKGDQVSRRRVKELQGLAPSVLACMAPSLDAAVRCLSAKLGLDPASVSVRFRGGPLAVRGGGVDDRLEGFYRADQGAHIIRLRTRLQNDKEKLHWVLAHELCHAKLNELKRAQQRGLPREWEEALCECGAAVLCHAACALHPAGGFYSQQMDKCDAWTQRHAWTGDTPKRWGLLGAIGPHGDILACFWKVLEEQGRSDIPITAPLV